MNGKCPKCGKRVLMAGLAECQIQTIEGKTWRGVQYFCQSCQAVLSVAIDPVAIKTDIVKEILKAFGKD